MNAYDKRHFPYCLILFGFCLISSAQAGESTPKLERMNYGIIVHHYWTGDRDTEIRPRTGEPPPPGTLNSGSAWNYPKRELTGSVPRTLDELAAPFNVEKFVADMKAFKVEYVIFTVWNAGMNVLYPSKAMDAARGPGHASRRDVTGELVAEMKKAGIPLYLYVHCSVGNI